MREQTQQSARFLPSALLSRSYSASPRPPSAPPAQVPLAPSAGAAAGRWTAITAGSGSTVADYGSNEDGATVAVSPHVLVEDATPLQERPMSFGPRSLDLYEKLIQVGEGTYGKVYKAKSRIDGKVVALKRIRMEGEKDGFPMTAMREIRLLQRLRHPNILHLMEIISGRGGVCMVFEYMDHDLTGVLGHPTFRYQTSHIKCLVLQMLEGLAYLHSLGILHRDIKGSNILLNKQGQLKMADFGLARKYVLGRKQDMTNRVITLWYRPPELLLGATEYGPEVDLWGVGCILVELYTKKPVFQGQDEVSQLMAIYSVCGTPNEQTWPSMVDLPWFHLIRPRQEYKPCLRDLYEKVLGKMGVELVQSMLACNPSQRISAQKALESPYFQEDPQACHPSELPSPEGNWHEFESKQRRRKAQHQSGHDRKRTKV